MATRRPDILFIMTDQQRFDTLAALGNRLIYTPHLDRLVKRGISFVNAYSTCPVCLPARYTVRTGCEPPTTRTFSNGAIVAAPGQAASMEGRCGPYLPRVLQRVGYRTFGVGKFHSVPWNESLGYEVHLHSEELYGSARQRGRDAYASWIAREHPEYDFIEGLMGERSEMYYVPQMSPMPAALSVERWAAERAGRLILAGDGRPYFGFVSFVGPHPPLAPPIPFNRMYDPDRMPNPVRGRLETDHMDEQIPYMNQRIWAESINDPLARILKARYYGEISYIDDCIGRLLDAVKAGGNEENTVICFFADHGDHMGDHHAWQKESFFEASCRVPFLVSWPARLPEDERCRELVSLTDLFAIATGAAGEVVPREGVDVLGMLRNRVSPRESLFGFYGQPGSSFFKVMVRRGEWKYIFMANGGREQLFDLSSDPDELRNMAGVRSEMAARLRGLAAKACELPGARDALTKGNLKEFPFSERPRPRFYQFDLSRGVKGFPDSPGDVLLEKRFRKEYAHKRPAKRSRKKKTSR